MHHAQACRHHLLLYSANTFTRHHNAQNGSLWQSMTGGTSASSASACLAEALLAQGDQRGRESEEVRKNVT
jgi:hypothetical protein